jgi:hypothetical protein
MAALQTESSWAPPFTLLEFRPDHPPVVSDVAALVIQAEDRD